MKLRIKDLYGIRDKEMIFDSENKNNIIIFAPNGVGKTSIYKGFKDIVDGIEYNGKEKGDVIPVFEFQYNGDENISYNSDIENTDNILLIDHSFDSIYKPRLFDIIALDEKIKIEKSGEKIIAFHKKTLNEAGMDNFLEINDDDYIQILNKYDKQFKGDDIDGDIDEINSKIKSLTEIHNNINSVLANKELAPKTIGEYYELSSGNNDEISVEQIINVKLINDIKSKKQKNADEFGFKQNQDGKYDPISQVSSEYLDISGKFTKEEIELLVSIKDMNDELIERKNDGSFNKTKGKLTSFNKILLQKIKDAREEKFIFILKNKKGEIEKIKGELNSVNKKYIKKVNESIDTLNSLLNNEMLDWSMKFRNVEFIHDELRYDGIAPENMNSTNFENDFENYASEGQKKIILILAKLIPLFNKSGVVVLDDAINSFDNQHINELLKAIRNPVFKGVKFFILTHNFELLRSISFDSALSNQSKLFILDKIKGSEYKKIEGDFNEIQDIMTTNRIINDTSKANKYMKLVVVSTLLREAISNILMTNQFPIRGLVDNKIYIKGMESVDEYNSELVNLIEFIDQHLRHYKRNIKISNLLEEINKISQKIIETIPAIKEVKNILEKLKNDGDGDKVFGDEIINQNAEWEEIKTLDEFILLKIFMGIKIRFKIEKIKYYKEDKEDVIKLWESKDKWAEASKQSNVNLQSFHINFLAHANNIQWSKIIEYSIYKLLKMNDIK